MAVQGCRPIEAELVHETLAAALGRLTQMTAWRNHVVHNGADGSVDSAEKELQVRTALDLDEREELVHFKTGVILVTVLQQVGIHRQVVGQARAQGNADRLALLLCPLGVLVAVVDDATAAAAAVNRLQRWTPPTPKAVLRPYGIALPGTVPSAR